MVKDISVGLASGVVAWFASVMAVAITSAIAMPTGISLLLWDAVVVFGVGAGLVAFVVHLLALRVFKPSPLVALMVFAAVVVACVAATGPLTYSYKFITAAVIGAMGASLISGLRPNSSFKPTPSAPLK